MDEDEVYLEHVILDLTDCKYVNDFWERVKLAFEFQNHFGKNWDAFWDMLEFECPAHKVTVIGANTLPENWKTLDERTYPEKIREILQKNMELCKKYNEEFDYEFIDA